MYDVVIIGGGVVGCAVARELSKYKLAVALLEKSDDVAGGASKANSGIVHAGYDALPCTLKARFNLEGNKIYPSLAKELGVPFQNIGSLVLANSGGLPALEKLAERGAANGVEGLEIFGRDKLVKAEPFVADEVAYGLFAPTASIVSPYEMTVALAEFAAVNGVKFEFECAAENIEKTAFGYRIHTEKGAFETRVLVNAAGAGARTVNKMCGGEDFEDEFVRGDYIVLDNVERKKYIHTCFPLPDERGKGCLVSPTADGNVIAGPTAIPVKSAEETATTREGIQYIKEQSKRIIKNINFGKTIRVFSGLRVIVGEDFVIRREGSLVTLAGICSPGLTAAPAIAKHVAEELIPQTGLVLGKKAKTAPRPIPPVTREMGIGEWNALIAKDSAYSKIVCRCEKVTEGEIFAALDSPLKPRSLDALKRRVRVGMGRCQGGFCTPRLMEIMSKRLDIPFECITKKGKGSEIAVCKIKEGL